MNALSTLPASLRQRLEQADSLFERGYIEEGHRVLEQAHIELARQQPELCALMMAAQQGYHGIVATTVEQTTTMERVQRTFLGFPVGEEWQPVTTTKVTQRTLRLF